MKLENFLNSADIDSIIASYTTIPAPVDGASSDEDEYGSLAPPPSINQTLEALQPVLQCEEYSEVSQKEGIQMLESLERHFKTPSISQQRQRIMEDKFSLY